MDDYAMGLFLAARRKILSAGSDTPACLCIALCDVICDEGGYRLGNKEIQKLFLAFAEAYDGNRFWSGKLMERDYEFDTGITACWWYPIEDKIPRIAMIDFLVGR
ncbi:MAG: hypothetical protein IPK44_01975 [Candidatus Accumulibacter sp.]|uniref:hypothetical protein n=1 Tax=Accumulibacter sp. TaxID=2053492 RepID=UPI00258497C8|nr:hypothetical protein [Accumulibacter sp.]MBK8113369.1 hypothetical protein [Accumulibacter sp.]